MKSNLWQSEFPQIEHPYYSTIAFEAYIADCTGFRNGSEILDIGTGIGSNLHYFAIKHLNIKFIGADYNADKIAQARELATARGLNQLTFEAQDWFDLTQEYNSRFDGIMNIHTLCCFKNVESAINALCVLKPRWIAFNSLFYDGPLDVLIHIRDYTNLSITDDNPDGDFNIFSLPKVREVFASQGYQVRSKPFNMPKTLSRPEDGARGTYTINTEWHSKTQFSGPVHLPWYFVFAERKEAVD